MKQEYIKNIKKVIETFQENERVTWWNNLIQEKELDLPLFRSPFVELEEP